MSDINDELLNYEEELDDPTLVAAADEDDALLLSDEELEKNVTSEQKALLKDEAEKWVKSKLKLSTKTAESLQPEVVTTSSSYHEALSVSPQRNKEIVGNDEGDLQTTESDDVTTSEVQSEILHKENELHRRNSESNDQQSKNDEVTSTNKEIEDQSVSQTITQKSDVSEHEEHLTSKGDVIQSSQESSNVVEEQDFSTDPREDVEERSERTNIKHTNERGKEGREIEIDQIGKYQHARFFHNKRGRGGIRGGHYSGPRGPVKYPHINYPPYTPTPISNENSIPQVQYTSYQPTDPQKLAPRQPYPIPNQMAPRLEYRPQIVSFRPQNPNEFMYRGSRPDYASQINGAPQFNGPQVIMRPIFRPDGSMPPQGVIRHRMPMPPRMVPPPNQNQMQNYMNTPQPIGVPNTSHPNNFTILANVQNPNSNLGQPVIPRKVLINPDFKGGVEAATSQLMKDTQFLQTVSSQAAHLQSDEELFRQQEEFIKKNRMHIEKRRYELSPDRRSRSRERSYSPPRRDRRGDSRERRGTSPSKGRGRGPNREPIGRFLKRRRSNSYERNVTREKERMEEEEDEETRAYRQEIEKQKAMREKILRDKEMRRRKAAENKQTDEKPSTSEEPPQKLKPLIVTESKIISLKKKATADSSTQSSITPTTTMTAKQLQTKVLPESKRVKNTVEQQSLKDASTTTLTSATTSRTMAVIKPVIKKTISTQVDIKNATTVVSVQSLSSSSPSVDTTLNVQSVKNDEDTDNDSIDEDLLLADTPSPPLSPASPPPPSFFAKSKQSAKTIKLTDKSNTINSSSTSPPHPPPPSSTTTQTTTSKAFSSSNRRVILKSSTLSSATSSSSVSTTDHQAESKISLAADINRKPIFDRLEKKIGVNESAKRKIQRIVIKNTE